MAGMALAMPVHLPSPDYSPKPLMTLGVQAPRLPLRFGIFRLKPGIKLKAKGRVFLNMALFFDGLPSDAIGLPSPYPGPRAAQAGGKLPPALDPLGVRLNNKCKVQLDPWRAASRGWLAWCKMYCTNLPFMAYYCHGIYPFTATGWRRAGI